MKSVFRYPGAKAQLSSWVIDHFPAHHCYVEPFAGSAAVLVNKPESDVEVINDRDGDIVHFFRVLRDRGDELADWLRDTPFSRQLHQEFATAFYDGHRPDDDIERAGRFFYLRETQFAQKYHSKSGFRASQKQDHATRYQSKTTNLRDFASRLRSVQIESNDYERVFEIYDDPTTLFYCDPPYMDEGDALYSHDGGFDHGRFVSTLEETAGRWVVSYTRVPEPLQTDDNHIVEKDKRVSMSAGHYGEHTDKTVQERLVMNFDPAETPSFTSGSRDQGKLGQFVADGGESR